MLINCITYQNGVKLAALAVEEISDYLERKDCFAWVELRDITDANIKPRRRNSAIHCSDL